MKKFLILSVLFFCTSICLATTYYISPLGNDVIGNGSFLLPWRTLHKATSTVTGQGDIIHVNSGVYTETAQCALAVGVSIEGDGITSVIQSTLTGNFIPILSLFSSVEGTNGNQHISNLKFDGQNMSSAWGICIVGRSNVSVHDCTIVDFREVGVNFSGIGTQNGYLPPSVYATGNSFYNNIVINCSTNDTVYGRGCMQFGGQVGMLVYNNIITQPYRTGTFTGNIGWPMKMANEGYIKDCKVYNNTLKRAIFTGSGHGVHNDWNFSFEMWNIEGLEMYGNTLQGEVDIVNATRGNSAYGLNFHDNIVSYPTLSTYFQSGIRLETNESDIIISDNSFLNMEQGIAFSPHDYLGNGFGIDIHRVTIKNNLFTNMGVLNNSANSTIRFEGTQANLSDLFIYNNTLVGAIGSSNTMLGIVIPSYSGSVTNTKIINNIITNYTYTSLFFGCVVNTLAIQHNNLHANGNGNNPIFSGGAAVNYTNSANTNTIPLFIGGGIYTLQPASLNIDAGMDVGIPFSGASPDKGYAEFGGVINLPPIADAGLDQSVTLPIALINLTGSGTDPDGTITSYSWTQVGGPAPAIILNPLIPVAIVTSLIPGTYKFELKVIDNNGAIGKDTTNIIVTSLLPGNNPPAANAGADQSITLPINTVNLAGSGTDTDGTIAAYLWTKIAGPAAGTITNINAAATSVTGLTAGTYSFELTVTDNDGATDTDTVLVTVNPAVNILPTANAGADQAITLPLNTVNLAGSGTDPDGTITAYLWTKIAGPTGTGTITNPTSAATSVTGLVAGTYKFRLRVTDNNGGIARDTMEVIVNPLVPVNLAPTANAGADQSITLPLNTVNLAGSGTDTDGTITAYLWTKIAGPTTGTITNINAAATSVTGLIAGTYRFELTVTDNSGATGKDTMEVIVNALVPVNVAPTANAGADQSITLPLNTVNLTGSATDPDGTIVSYIWTKISGPAAGVITNTGLPSTAVTGLTAGVYQFELRVTDNNGAFGRDTVQVTVNPIVPVNVAPTANAGADQSITLPLNTVNLTGSGIDPDGTIISYIWTKISGPSAGIIANPGLPSTAVTGLTAGVYQFELRVTDNNGAMGRDTVQVTVNPIVPVNVAPTANAGADQTITLPASTINLSGSGTDPDGTITAYLWTKISGPAAGVITNANAAATSVTRLVAGTYSFELRVTDNSGATDTDTMQVVVNPIPNVPPTANAGADQFITLPVNTVTLQGSGTDTDGTITVYHWTKIAGPAAGVITNANAAATSITGLAGGVYKFMLQVTDNNGAADTDTVQVVVFVPNIAPTANAGLNQSITLPTNTASLSGTGNDVDGTIVSYIWTKISGPSAGVVANPGLPSTTVAGLTAGVYRFELRVTDNNGAFGRDTVQVTVNPSNIPPVSNAGPDQSIVLPTTTVTLTGSGTDVDGTIAGYTWRQVSGPVDKLTSIHSPVTVLNNLIVGTYIFELTVTDNKGATDKDTVKVVSADPVIPSANTIKVYPNPVADITTLDIGRTTNASALLIIITDMQGKNVYTKQLSAGSYSIKESLNMSTLSKGTYLITVYFNGKEKQTLKVLKL